MFYSLLKNESKLALSSTLVILVRSPHRSLFFLYLLWVGLVAFTLGAYSFGTCGVDFRLGSSLLQRILSEEQQHSEIEFQGKTASAPVCSYSDIEAQSIDFTLVTQLSPARLLVMKEQCRRWGPHPISVGIGGSVSKEAIVRVLVTMGCDEELLTVTVIHEEEEGEYPVNKLRNAALAAIKTSHAVYVDADFLVSPDLYADLATHREALVDPKTALVVPAFQLNPLGCALDNSHCENLHLSLIPEHKSELSELFGSIEDDAAITPFDYKKNVGGHNSTRYEDWFHQVDGELLPIECLQSDRYEPYLVLRYCRDLPPFQEAFVGYGKNKVTWVQHVVRAGYQFFQVPNGFAVHFPHKKSSAFRIWDQIKTNQGRESLPAEHLAAAYLEWMETNVPDKTVMPQCSDQHGTNL